MNNPSEGQNNDIHIDTSIMMLIDQNLLYIHLSWCFWHEGIRLYDDSFPGIIRDIGKLRRECAEKQEHNAGAQNLINSASNNELKYALSLIEPRIESEHQLSIHFRWVAYHENQRNVFLDALQNGNYGGIRSVFFNYQNHNSNAINLLSCISNAYIKDLIDAL